ncbi:MAG: hypothetical protein RLZZ618_2755 [Pseudomonadota bacterium]|jgi:AraC-like DNA-binding protein
MPRTLSPPVSSAPSDTAEAKLLRDNSYVLGFHGFIYTSPDLPRATTVRHPATLLISADYTPFRVATRDGPMVEVQAALVPPLVSRRLDAPNVPILSFNVMPAHAAFHAFRAMQHPGVWPLDRHAFNKTDDEFTALLEGTAGLAMAESVFQKTVDEALRHVPPTQAPDPKALELIRLLDANPRLGLDELAERFGRSPQGMSRWFTSAVGMSLRDYHNWLKQRRVYHTLYTQRSLTEVAFAAGFADSPQFTRAYQRWYGQSPSAARDPRFVRVLIASANMAAQADAPTDSQLGD